MKDPEKEHSQYAQYKDQLQTPPHTCTFLNTSTGSQAHLRYLRPEVYASNIEVRFNMRESIATTLAYTGNNSSVHRHVLG